MLKACTLPVSCHFKVYSLSAFEIPKDWKFVKRANDELIFDPL